MIMEKESEIKVLRNFCDNPFEYFSISETSKKTKISINWTYKIIKKFEGSGILSKFGKKHKLDFSALFCKRLKLLLDSEYLNSLDVKIRKKVLHTADKLIFELNPKSVVLVGSVALSKQKKESDVDFLVIGKKKEIPLFENCNIIIINEGEFKEKYLKGDDFIISSLLFGKIIYDNNLFIKFFECPLPVFSQEIIQEKIKYCEKLEERIYTLLKLDEKKAREELIYLALQAARIVLLRNKTSPKTKHDIAGQVRPFNKKIARIVEELLKKKEISKKEMLDYVKTCRDTIR